MTKEKKSFKILCVKKKIIKTNSHLYIYKGSADSILFVRFSLRLRDSDKLELVKNIS